MSIGSLNSRLLVLNKATLDSSIDLHSQPIIPIADICLGEFNAEPVNTVAVDDCIFFAALGAQSILKISQQVGSVVLSNIVISILQDVQLHIEVEEFTPIEIAQETVLNFTSEIIKINQIVNNPATFLSLYGWDVDILINNIPLDKAVIKGGKVTITKESNQNSLCQFDVIVPNVSDFLDFIDGAEIIINYITASDITRIYTGIVDIPEIHMIEKTRYITVKCSNRREDLIKAKMLSVLPTIGRYSKNVQGEITTIKQEMDYRLETTTQDVDFDSYNIPNINSWYSKATPDYIFYNADVFLQKPPQITWQSRGNVINDITVTVKYDYTRLYQYSRNFDWVDSGDPSVNSTPVFLGNSVVWLKDAAASHLTVGMLKAAIDQAGWKREDSLTYVDHYVNPNFCVQLYLGAPCLNTLNDDVGTTRVRELAPPYAYHTVMYAIPPSTEDETRITAANWTASTRFSQNVEEVYTCIVKSTQSINQFGDLTYFMNHTVNDPFDATQWEKYQTGDPIPTNAIHSGPNAWANQNPNITEFNNAILTAIDRAKTKIIGSHRDTKVTLQMPIKPYIELRHTIEIDMDAIQCKGKVSKITHTLDLSDRPKTQNGVNGHSTEIDITLFRSKGSAATTPTTVPSRPLDTPHFDTTTVHFGTRRDQDPDTTPGSETWNGYIGSINHGFQNPQKTKFVVDTPAIPDELRKLRILNSNTTFETALQSDNLEIA